MIMKSLAGIALLMSAATAVADDFPMLGGRPDRNMVSPETNLAVSWNSESGMNILWSADLGTDTYGSPAVAGGRVLIGTNNGTPRDPSVRGDRGILMCFSVSDGAFLWQAVHEKLGGGTTQDWPEIGICSTPCIDGDRVFYVSNRAELVCCDAEGFLDGENDGPFTGETLRGKRDADFIWILDMRKELGILPLNASASSPLVRDGRVFVLTGNGADEKTHTVKQPDAPSFISVERATGKLVWKDNSPGDRILAGQWGSPAYGTVAGRPQVVFPGGDGRLYAFDPATGKRLWSFNCKGHEKEPTDSYLVATPAFFEHRVFAALGADPEAGGGPGCLWAIDARGNGDLTEAGGIWNLASPDIGGSISTVAVRDGLVYATEVDGYLNCIDLQTGKRVWRHDFLATVWGSPLVADAKVYVSNEDGEVVVLKEGREKAVLATNRLPGILHGSVVAADGVLFLAAQSRLLAVRKEDPK